MLFSYDSLGSIDKQHDSLTPIVPRLDALPNLCNRKVNILQKFPSDTKFLTYLLTSTVA